MGDLDDPAIRAMLHTVLRASGYVPRDEIPVSIAVVDVLAVDTEHGRFHGFEIKSDRDSVVRLPTQVQGYGAVLDACTLVVGQRHEAKAAALIPPWWGLWRATESELVRVRPAEDNPEPGERRLHLLGAILWNIELAAMCEHHGCARGVRGRSCIAMVKRLRWSIGDDAFRREAATVLRARKVGPDAFKETMRETRRG